MNKKEENWFKKHPITVGILIGLIVLFIFRGVEDTKNSKMETINPTPDYQKETSKSVENLDTSSNNGQEDLNPIITLRHEIGQGLPPQYKNQKEWEESCTAAIFKKCENYERQDNNCYIDGELYEYKYLHEMLDAQGCNHIIIENGDNYDWHDMEIKINGVYIVKRIPESDKRFPNGERVFQSGGKIKLDPSYLISLKYVEKSSEEDCNYIKMKPNFHYYYDKYNGKLCDIGRFGFSQMNEPIKFITITVEEGTVTKYFN